MVQKKNNEEKLTQKSKSLRCDVIKMVYNEKSGHLGGSLSIIEILISLYYHTMNIDPKNPKWEDRDRLILSKGHTAPAQYAVLADVGFFEKDLLFTSYRKIGSSLQGHPDLNKTPGIDMTTGSLGIGLSAACGIAWGSKMLKKEFYVYAILGDGETNEGQIWEAAMTGAHHQLDNIIAFVDLNGMQNDGFTKDIMKMENMVGRWKAFGWDAAEVNGHDIFEILEAIKNAKKVTGKPSVIICNTIKGKGVSFMENSVVFHGGCPNKEQYECALKELE